MAESADASGGGFSSCARCGYAHYCSRSCQQAHWLAVHKYECRSLAELASQHRPTSHVMLVARVARRLLARDDKGLEQHNDSAAVDALMDHMSEHPREALARFQQIALYACKLNRLEPTSELVARLVRLCCQSTCNTFSIVNGELQAFGGGCYPAAALFNHSCAPNCVVFFGENATVNVRTVLPVAAGDELTVCYIESAQPTALRRRELRERYFFDCHCERCDMSLAHAQLDGMFCAIQCRQCPAGAAAVPDSAELGAPLHDVYYCVACRQRTTLAPERRAALAELVARAERGIAHKTSDSASARDDLRASVPELARVLHPHHALLIRAAAAYEDACIALESFDEALEASRICTPSYQVAYGPLHPLLGVQYLRHAKLAWLLQHNTEAFETFQKAAAMLVVCYGEGHPLAREAQMRLTESAVASGKAGGMIAAS